MARHARKPTRSKVVTLSVAPRRHLTAKYDAAQTTDDNRRHWAAADALSANSANSKAVRTKLVQRARYESANNSYARGIVLTLANDTIGTGPRLQLLLEVDDKKTLESEFTAWAKAVGLAEKLRTMRQAKAVDGEAFGLLVNNPNVAGEVKLDLRLIEADQVTSPVVTSAEQPVDGILLDDYGNPRAYRVLKQHPGEASASISNEAQEFPAASVIHWFRSDRPGQYRGVPDILPALPLFAQLRRYTLAVIDAAETAADFAAVGYTDDPIADAQGNITAASPLDTVEVERRMMTFLPSGYKLGQIKAEQPTTTYDMFKREIINEIARCLNMPYNVAACNSSDYNYASGRLDHQVYYKSIRVEQAHCEAVVLDRILAAWMAEAMRVYRVSLDAWPHQWFWEGNQHVDPLKEANAQQIRLASHTTTLAAEYAGQGKDWETELRQRAKEVKLQKELGILVDLTPAQNVNENQNVDPEEDDPPAKSRTSRKSRPAPKEPPQEE